ncbi:hypothetical protein ABKV19_011563 [Rosa sericea]
MNQLNLKIFIYASGPASGFETCEEGFGDPKFNLDAEPIYDEYDDNYNLIIGSKNHMKAFKFFEALDVENSDQQVVKCNSQFVANSEDTMFHDMVVGDKANLCSSSSPKLQLKIMLRQPTRILGGQDYPSHKPNSSKFFNAKYLCSFPTSSHKRDFYPTNFDTSELGVKHRWPPLWSSRGITDNHMLLASKGKIYSEVYLASYHCKTLNPIKLVSPPCLVGPRQVRSAGMPCHRPNQTPVKHPRWASPRIGRLPS